MTNNIPRTSAQQLRELVAGYEKIADVGEEITDEGVAEVRDISKDLARRQKKFVAEIGVLEKDGWDYFLTEKGQKLGNYWRFNQNEQAQQILGDLLKEWEPTPEILSYFDNGRMTEEEFKNKIGFVTSTELSNKRKNSGAKALIDLYEWSGFVEQDGGEYQRSSENQTAPEEEYEQEEPFSEPDQKPSEERLTADGEGDTKLTPKPDVSKANGVDITLELSGDDDPENIRQLLLAIRAGTEQDLREYDSSEEANTEQ